MPFGTQRLPGIRRLSDIPEQKMYCVYGNNGSYIHDSYGSYIHDGPLFGGGPLLGGSVIGGSTVLHNIPFGHKML